jgi:HIV Tat-specific factor 1
METWYYLEPQTQDKKGPLPTSVLEKLLEKGILGLDSTTLVWKGGFENWQPMGIIEPFKSILVFYSKQWYYIEDQLTKGPVATRFLVHKLQKGDLDGLSLVFESEWQAWKELSSVPKLKEILRKISEEEETLEQMAKAREQQQLIDDSMLNQTFEPDSLQPFDKSVVEQYEQFTKQNAASLALSTSITNNKYFVGDDGTYYTWDEEEDDWVGMDDEEVAKLQKELEAEQEGGDGNYKKDRRQNNSKKNSKNKESNSNVAKNKKRSFEQISTVETYNNKLINDVIHNPPDNEDKEGEEEEEADEDDHHSILSHSDTMSIDATTSINNQNSNINNNNNNDSLSKVPKKKRKNRKKKRPNTWIYIEGLPPDITVEEIKQHFSKVGLIALSPYDQQPRIKIYKEVDTNNETVCKGDGLLCFAVEESVKLAVEILDGGYIRPNYRISVTKASFDQQQHHHHHDSTTAGASTTNNPAQQTLMKPPVISQTQIKIARTAMKQALAWNEDDDIGIANKSSALKIVVLEGMFSQQEIQKLTSIQPPNHPHTTTTTTTTTDDNEHPLVEQFFKELEEELTAECQEKFGEIDKLTIFTKNPRGIVVIKFKTAFAAEECIRIMNGRYFAGKRLKSYYWDGVTNYSIVIQSKDDEEEIEKDESKRLDEFGKWLDEQQEDLPEELRLRVES